MRLTISPSVHRAFFWPGAVVWVIGCATGLWATTEAILAVRRFFWP
jgi:hypothetical protein